MGESAKLAVGGVPEGHDACVILAETARCGGPVVHVARDDRRMARIEAALRFHDPATPVVRFPAWDCQPYDRVSPRADISAARMATLAGLVHGMPTHFVLLTTAAAAMQLAPSRDTLRGATFAATAGRRIDEEALKSFLVRMGFSRAPTVTEPGDFAVRGGIIDVFPPGTDAPVRLDLFGDLLEGIRRFDPASQRTQTRLERVELAPASEVVLDANAIRRFRQRYRAAFGSGGAEDPLYEAVSEGRKRPGLEHWLPFFHERLETVFDYLPEAPVTIDDQAEAARAARWDAILDKHEARLEALGRRDREASVYKPVPPEQLFLDDAAWEAALAGRRVSRFSPLPQPPGPGCADAMGRAGRDFAEERLRRDESVFRALKAHVEDRLRHGPVLIASASEGASERLEGLLADEGLAGAVRVGDMSAVRGRRLHLAVWELDHGYETPEATVVSEQDVLGDRLVREPGRRRAENFLTEARSLSPGELVMHVDHGVGRFSGLEVIDAAGTSRECLCIEYAEGGRIYLPVENIELLSRYGGEGGELDRLGAAAWQARKARLKNRIRDMAERLIRIAAERALRRAPVIEAPPHAWEEFASRFPYQETQDQEEAIADVMADLERGQPMDRLICGDAGFGKTEVALRAAFAVAMDGRQVAVLAPTTLLARQHFQTFSERFRGFGIEVGALSRLVPPGEAARVREGMSRGEVGVAIGTHALLAKGVSFANLGLLVVDEEHRFGVAHKERLKRMRSDVHVLTMTATPIPRTLQMSLEGVRDMSVIGAPPVDRLSIRTYVGEFDEITVREALLRELYRGGQSFFVVPRISDLPEIEEFLREQVPEVGYIVAHGQMPPRELDRRMNAFYDGACDVLLATSIVESGLDIPTANTLVVHRADRFGLAQLYQLRGRVGRAKVRAYAHLTTRRRSKLTEAGEERLRALGSIDSLGAGFSLAVQDLELRGAGNVIGEEQSGQMREVGYELYHSMLEEAVAKIRAGEGAAAALEAQDKWAPQINLGVSVLIPERYVRDMDVRLGLYRRIGALRGRIELEGFAAELVDRFGKLPKEVSMLLRVVRIKEMCKRAGIARLDGGPKGATIRFHEGRCANPAGLADYVIAQGDLAKLRDDRLILRRDWREEADRIKGAFAVARDLAERIGGADAAPKEGAAA